MSFEEILDQAMAMLQRRGRLTYSTLKRQFQLDDAALDDLKNECIYGQRLAVDEEGRVLVWAGAAVPAVASESVQAIAPLAYTPPIGEKILTSRVPWKGGSTSRCLCRPHRLDELIRPRSRAAQQLLDPAIPA